MVVSPEGTESTNSGSGPGRRGGAGAMVIALAAVLISGLTLVSLTSPDPDALEAATSTSTSTTSTRILTPTTVLNQFVDEETFTVAQVARGQPLKWEAVIADDDNYPVALVDHEDWLYLFSSETAPFSGNPGGLRAWRTSDGVKWEHLGQVIEASHLISIVSSTPQGLVAIEPGKGGAGFTVWRSGDGTDWEPDEAVVDGVGEAMGLYPYSVGGNEDVLVVFGHIEPLIYTLANKRIAEIVGPEIANYGWGTEIVDDEIKVTVYGPLGFPLAVLSAEEMGLTEKERQLFASQANATAPSEAEIWVSAQERWQEAEILDAEWIDSFIPTPDGDILALGYGRAGSQAWVSSDGMSWEQEPAFPHPYTAERWEDRLIGPSTTGTATLLVSRDGRTWEDLGLSALFPHPIDWSVQVMGSGPGGVAAVIVGWSPFNRSAEPSPEPVTVPGEGGNLVLDFTTGTYVLEPDDGQSHRWTMTATKPDGIEIDLATRRLVFNDPETGEQVASFDLGAITNAQESYWVEERFGNRHLALAFTPDGSDWTIQDLGDIGTGSEIAIIEVTEDHVVAVGTSPAVIIGPVASPGFQVWTAAIP